MTDEHTSLSGHPVDTDYCNVPDAEAADVSYTPDDADDLDRQPPPESDKSWRYDTEGAGTLAGTDMDEVMDTEAVISNDGRSDTRTMFYLWEAPDENGAQYKRMLQHNEGMWESERKAKNQTADNNRWIDSFCTQLDVTPYQRERTRHIISSTDLRRMGHYSAQESILGAISIVCNSDDRWVRDEDHYRRLVGDVGSDMYNIRNVRDLLRRKSSALDS